MASLNSTPGSPQEPLTSPKVNPDDKENEKKGDREKVVETEEAQVFNENGDTMTLEKRKLSRHQESAQKPKDSKESRCPRYVPFYENSNARWKSPSNHTEGLCKKLKDLKTTTYEESLIFVYKYFGKCSCTIKNFATNTKLLNYHLNKTQELSPKIFYI